jgi:AAA+ superfamily predicted ATPase
MHKKRPSLPIGHSVGNLPPITNALHADDRFEVYSLDSTGADFAVLLLARGIAAASTEAGRLSEWWTSQTSSVLRQANWLPATDSPPNTLAASINLHGSRLDATAFAKADDATLRRVLYALLDSARKVAPSAMFPDFRLPLLWRGIDELEIVALLPLEDSVPSGADQVRLVAASFYQLATGIDVWELEGEIPGLRSWSRSAGTELARVIDRCFVDAKSKDRITSLSMLDRELGRAVPEPTGSADEPASRITTVSAAGRGLDRVAGMHELKELLYEQVVKPVRNPEEYKRYGLSIPNGILLYGPPGCGKTYIARQLAEELHHSFFEIIPSELASAYIHHTVVKIRELFDDAEAQAPSIIFVDEFEALVPSRGGLGGHQQYKAEEVNEFLAHLNGSAEKRIFVIAATNQPAKIDAAVLRTGRLDKHIYVGPPDLEARTEMLALHLHGRPVAADVDLTLLALVLEGYSASDLRFLVDEAARESLKLAQEITNAAFVSARTRVRASVTPEVEAQSRTIEQRGF